MPKDIYARIWVSLLMQLVNFCKPMDISIKFDTFKSGWSVKSVNSSLLRSQIVTISKILFDLFDCLFDLILYVHSTIFQLCGTVLPGLNQY